MHKYGTQWDRKMSKTGVYRAEVPHHVQVSECPPPSESQPPEIVSPSVELFISTY